MKSELFQIRSHRALILVAIGMVSFGLPTGSANGQMELLAIEFNDDDQEGFDIWPSELGGAKSIAKFAADASTMSTTTTVTLTTNTRLSIPVNRENLSDGEPDGFTYTNLYQDLPVLI